MDMSAQRQVLADATQRNAEVIRALGMLDRFTARWARANERYLQENIRASDVSANLGSGAKVLRYVLQSGMLGLGAYLGVADKASGGVMIASSIMMGRALAPVEVALGTWKQLISARQGVKRLREICKATAMPAAPPVELRPSRELSVQNLSVMAPGMDRLIVANVSFALSAGMGLALLGASASGKTSLSKALVGIWPAHPAWCGSTAARSTSGATAISAAMSAICRRTSRCSTARWRKTSAASTRPPRRTRS